MNSGAVSDIRQSYGFGVICNDLLTVNAACLSVYMNGSLCGLDIINIKASAAVFFQDINLGLSVKVSGLVFSTLTKLQAIALALECVPFFWSVDLFSDSQTALDACKLEFFLICPDFRNWCWIEYCHITDVICHKNLNVNWIKVRGHLGVSGNECTDALAKNVIFSAWQLLYLTSEKFLRAGSTAVSNSHLATGFISMQTADLRTYFMKALHYWLPVAMCKCLYDKCYPSVVCLFCNDIEISDHVFCCLFDVAGHAWLLDTYVSVWEFRSSLFQSSLCVLQLLHICVSDVAIGLALCKGFVFNNWYHKSVSVFRDLKIAMLKVVDFIHEFCLTFRENIWLVHAKHQAFMEKNGLILHDSSIPTLISGLFMLFLTGMVRLLSIVEVFGVSFGFCNPCLFFSGIGDLVSVHIGV
ncbi:hypothetical protein G9A89_003749 [Geosiphon pyriformis]|nr:hypothetical protein G9A89_003749 [Geosiphon pyriformis]